MTPGIKDVVDEGMVDMLVQLSAVFEQTKERIGRHWFKREVVALAEQRLFKLIESLDANQLAYLTALCWFGETRRYERNDDQLLTHWAERLAYARTTIENDPRADIAYLIPRLRSLDAGLQLLSTLNPTGHSD